MLTNENAIETILVDAVHNVPANWLDIAVGLLRQGECVGVPTETVYGLAANALVAEAPKKIFEAKGRPADNPLIVHVSSLAMLFKFLNGVEPPADYESLNWVPEAYREAIVRFWPGSLTLLFPKPESCPKIITAGSNMVAIRWPCHRIMNSIIEACGFPLAAPSANLSGKPSPTLAEHVWEDLHGKIACIVDGGPSQLGLESTIVNGLVDPPLLLRPGGVAFEDLQSIKTLANLQIYTPSSSKIEIVIPGMKYRHYSPDAKVELLPTVTDVAFLKAVISESIHRIRSEFPGARVAILTHSLTDLEREEMQKQLSHGVPSPAAVALLPLCESISTDAYKQIAHNLFAIFRDMDRLQMSHILVEQVPKTREGLAIMNRLCKAVSK